MRGAAPSVAVVASFAMLVVSACSSTRGSQQPTCLASSVPREAVSEAPSAPPATACRAAQLAATAGGWGPAAGTSYVLLHVSLRDGAACLLPANPAVDLRDASGRVIASGPSTEALTVLLTTTLDLRLGWASWCATPPPSPLTARLSIGASHLDVELPKAFFASCQGVATIVSVRAVGT
jgi:hypothetical protein